MTPSHIRAALLRNNIPLPSGTLLDARWLASDDYWYVRTEDGWLWYAGPRGWLACPLGPPGETGL